MSGRLVPICALLCDDIRYEADDGISVMGIITPEAALSEYPASKRLAVVLIVRAEKEGRIEIVTTLLWKGAKRWSAKHELEITGVADGLTIPITGPVAHFDEPGELLLEVEYGGKAPYKQAWQFEAPTEEDIAKTGP